MSHLRTVLIAFAASSVSVALQALPPEHRWRWRLLVWLTGLLLGVGL